MQNHHNVPVLPPCWSSLTWSQRLEWAVTPACGPPRGPRPTSPHILYCRSRKQLVIQERLYCETLMHILNKAALHASLFKNIEQSAVKHNLHTSLVNDKLRSTTLGFSELSGSCCSPHVCHTAHRAPLCLKLIPTVQPWTWTCVFPLTSISLHMFSFLGTRCGVGCSRGHF